MMRGAGRGKRKTSVTGGGGGGCESFGHPTCGSIAGCSGTQLRQKVVGERHGDFWEEDIGRD